MATKKPKDNEPRLGIFWAVRGKLVFDSCSLAQAEVYGDFRNHPRSHIDVWRRFRRDGLVPPESQYEEYPRGRVIQHGSEDFMILADRCILGSKSMIAEIKKELNLPKATPCGPDAHYRCFRCLYGEEDL